MASRYSINLENLLKKQTLTLFEHQKKSYQDLGWKSDDPRISTLEQFVEDVNTPFLSFDRHALKATHFVGIVRVENMSIQILPKIDYEGSSDTEFENEVRQKAIQSATSNLLSLLSYTHDLQIRAKDLADVKEQPADWFELLTRIFATELHAQLRLGLEHAYTVREETLPVIRGRWLISQQLATHPYQRHRFDVVYDEFSPDTPLNQIFRFVTQRLLQVTADNQNRRYLQDILNWTDDLSADVQPIQVLLPKVHFSRLNERFRPAFNLAQLFLEGLTIQLSAGNKEVFAFIFNMNLLFEEFVGRFLIRHWKVLNINLYQDLNINLQSKGRRIYLAEYVGPTSKQVFEIIPDIQLLMTSGKPYLIADTKYKQLNPKGAHHGVAESDLYQMIAYSIRLDCPRLLLLYPQSKTGRIRIAMKIQNQPQKVKIATVNLHIPLSDPNHLIVEFKEILNPLLTE